MACSLTFLYASLIFLDFLSTIQILDSFFRVVRFKYVTSNSIGGSFYDRDSDRICQIFDVIFKDHKDTFHHISIRGLFNGESLDTIFYVSSDDEL